MANHPHPINMFGFGTPCAFDQGMDQGKRMRKDGAGFRLGLTVAMLAALYLGARADEKDESTKSVEVIRHFVEASGLGKAGMTGRAYHLSGTFSTQDGKVNGTLDVDQKDQTHQWLKVEIPQHGKHLRARNGEVMWHFDPPQNSRAGDNWFIYPRPGYVYQTNESQIRFHELFDIYDARNAEQFSAIAIRTNLNGRNCFLLRHVRANGRTTEEFFDSESSLRIAIQYGPPEPVTFLIPEYKEFNDMKIPARVIEVANGKTNDVLTVAELSFTNFAPSRFSMPLRVRDWPAQWNEFDEAYPPPSFVTEKWPWKGEHSRYFHEGFGETNSPYFWSYVVFNALEGETLKTAEELKDALHRYDAALYGKGYAPEKIKITVGSETFEKKLGHEVSRRDVQIDGFDAEATRKPLTTYLQVFRWYCPTSDRTGMMVLRSPRKFGDQDDVWQTLLFFWREAECHDAATAAL